LTINTPSAGQNWIFTVCGNAGREICQNMLSHSMQVNRSSQLELHVSGHEVRNQTPTIPLQYAAQHSVFRITATRCHCVFWGNIMWIRFFKPPGVANCLLIQNRQQLPRATGHAYHFFTKHPPLHWVQLQSSLRGIALRCKPFHAVQPDGCAALCDVKASKM
jgi:hypothetical protein